MSVFLYSQLRSFRFVDLIAHGQTKNPAHIAVSRVWKFFFLFLSSRTGGEGWREETNFIECRSPRPSPRSFLAGRGRRFLVVASRCARGQMDDSLVSME